MRPVGARKGSARSGASFGGAPKATTPSAAPAPSSHTKRTSGARAATSKMSSMAQPAPASVAMALAPARAANSASTVGAGWAGARATSRPARSPASRPTKADRRAAPMIISVSPGARPSSASRRAIRSARASSRAKSRDSPPTSVMARRSGFDRAPPRISASRSIPASGSRAWASSLLARLMVAVSTMCRASIRTGAWRNGASSRERRACLNRRTIGPARETAARCRSPTTARGRARGRPP